MAEMLRVDTERIVDAPRRLPLSGEVRSVAMVTTWQTQCGIADYASDLSAALLDGGAACGTVAVDRQRMRYMTEAELHAEFAGLAERAGGHDVVHVQHEYGFFAGAYGWGVSLRVFHRFLRTLRRQGQAVVVTMHTEPVFLDDSGKSAHDRLRFAGRRRLWWSLTRAVNNDPGVRIVVHSRTTRRRLVDSGLRAERITVIPQGIPQPRQSVDTGARRQARAELGVDDGAVVLGIFGFMSRYKGYNVALDALRNLPPEYHLLILGGPHPLGGDSALEDVLAELSRRKSLRDRVHLTGFVPAEELAALRSAVDICVAPYLTRPRLSSSAALSWALASGRPVIGSRIPAFEELSEDGTCLELVNPERPRELAHAIVRLAADPRRQEELVDNARAWCAANSWDARARDHLALYAALRRGGA
jgi:glycosyltransferase involved in cell wall biosynthesis